MDPVKNLIALIQEKLQLIPLKVRQTVYSVGALAAAVYAVYLAADGDWNTFWKSLIATAIGVVARANATGNNPPWGGGVDGSEPDLEDIDGETFDETADLDNPPAGDGTWNTDDIGDPTPAKELNLTTDRYGNIVTGE